MTDEDLQRIAMQSAQEAIEDGDMPFGACVVNERGFVLSVAHNRVNTSMDPTAHADVQAIRGAERKLRSPRPTWLCALHDLRAVREVL